MAMGAPSVDDELTPLEKEVRSNDILYRCRREPLNDADMHVPDGYRLQQRFALEVGDELPRERIGPLTGEIVGGRRQCIRDVAAVAPELAVDAPEVIGKKGTMRGKHDRQPLLDFIAKKIDLTFVDHAVDIVESNEIHPVEDFRRKNDVERIGRRNYRTGLVAIGLGRLFCAQPHVLRILMVAEAAKNAAAMLTHQIEVGAALEVDKIARMQHEIAVILRPRKRIDERLLLQSAESSRPSGLELLFFVTLVVVRRSKMGVGNMQKRKRPLNTDMQSLHRNRQPFVASAAGKNA